jgi:hypothetical protein
LYQHRFASETFRDAVGDNFGQKMANRAAVWKSLSDEVKEVCCLISGYIHVNLIMLFVVA